MLVQSPKKRGRLRRRLEVSAESVEVRAGSVNRHEKSVKVFAAPEIIEAGNVDARAERVVVQAKSVDVCAAG